MNQVPIQKVARYTHKGTLSHSKTFGAPLAAPESLYRVPQYIKDQGGTNYCTAAARSAAGSYLYGREMSFEYLTAKEGEVLGQPIFMGTDPNTADTAVANYGFLPDEQSPFNFQKDGWTAPAFWNTYPPALDGQAIVNCPGQPYNVYPDYDAIKAALISGAAENSIVIANGFWYANWNASGAILQAPVGSPITRHSYTFIDFKTVSGTEYLIGQLSQGKNFGDNGVLYFSKEVLNAAFASPAYNGLGCTIFRKEGATPIQTKIKALQRLVILLGELLSMLKLKV